MSGRTTWWAHDHAWHRRGAQMRLLKEFGPSGPWLLSIVCSLAQEQSRSTETPGGVTHDVFALACESGVDDEELTLKILRRAAEHGALDDLVVDEERSRFTARVSGWAAEQNRATEAVKKRSQRAKGQTGTNGDTGGQTDDCPPVSQNVPLPDQTRPDQSVVVVVDAQARDEAPSGSAITDLADLAANALTQAGFDEGFVKAEEPSIRQAVMDCGAGAATDWSAVAAAVRDARESGRLRRDNPASALRYVAAGGLPVLGAAKPLRSQGPRGSQSAAAQRSELTRQYAAKAMSGLTEGEAA